MHAAQRRVTVLVLGLLGCSASHPLPVKPSQLTPPSRPAAAASSAPTAPGAPCRARVVVVPDALVDSPAEPPRRGRERLRAGHEGRPGDARARWERGRCSGDDRVRPRRRLSDRGESRRWGLRGPPLRGRRSRARLPRDRPGGGVARHVPRARALRTQGPGRSEGGQEGRRGLALGMALLRDAGERRRTVGAPLRERVEAVEGRRRPGDRNGARWADRGRGVRRRDRRSEEAPRRRSRRRSRSSSRRGRRRR